MARKEKVIKRMVEHGLSRDIAEMIYDGADRGEQLRRIRDSECVFCGVRIEGREDFDDEPSWKQFKHGGLCQKCQDKLDPWC